MNPPERMGLGSKGDSKQRERDARRFEDALARISLEDADRAVAQLTRTEPSWPTTDGSADAYRRAFLETFGGTMVSHLEFAEDEGLGEVQVVAKTFHDDARFEMRRGSHEVTEIDGGPVRTHATLAHLLLSDFCLDADALESLADDPVLWFPDPRFIQEPRRRWTPLELDRRPRHVATFANLVFLMLGTAAIGLSVLRGSAMGWLAIVYLGLAVLLVYASASKLYEVKRLEPETFRCDPTLEGFLHPVSRQRIPWREASGFVKRALVFTVSLPDGTRISMARSAFLEPDLAEAFLKQAIGNAGSGPYRKQ